jgi:hypothetical protein
MKQHVNFRFEDSPGKKGSHRFLRKGNYSSHKTETILSVQQSSHDRRGCVESLVRDVQKLIERDPQRAGLAGRPLTRRAVGRRRGTGARVAATVRTLSPRSAPWSAPSVAR